MAATRENVLAAIVEYVEANGRRAPAKAIAEAVGDKLPVVQGIIKELIADGAIESSRGRNGGAKPAGAQIQKVEVSEPAETIEIPNGQVTDDVAAQFAALVAKLEADEAQAVAV